MKFGVWTWLAFVDKLASQNNGVKYLLVAVDNFSRFVIVQTMKTKYTKDFFQALRKMISRKKTLEKLWSDKETEYGGTEILGKLYEKELRKCSD